MHSLGEVYLDMGCRVRGAWGGGGHTNTRMTYYSSDMEVSTFGMQTLLLKMLRPLLEGVTRVPQPVWRIVGNGGPNVPPVRKLNGFHLCFHTGQGGIHLPPNISPLPVVEWVSGHVGSLNASLIATQQFDHTTRA